MLTRGVFKNKNYVAKNLSERYIVTVCKFDTKGTVLTFCFRSTYPVPFTLGRVHHQLTAAVYTLSTDGENGCVKLARKQYACKTRKRAVFVQRSRGRIADGPKVYCFSSRRNNVVFQHGEQTCALLLLLFAVLQVPTEVFRNYFSLPPPPPPHFDLRAPWIHRTLGPRTCAYTARGP